MCLLFLALRRARRRRLFTLLTLFRIRMALKERNYLIASSLIEPTFSPWYNIYERRDRGSFISVVSIDPNTFDYLLEKFSAHYIVKTGPGKRGRPPKFVNKHAVLACLLHSYTAAVENKTLCELFGVPPATLSRVLNIASEALSQTLKGLPEASIRFPDKETQLRWAALTNAREPLVKGVWGFVDGKNYRVQEPTNGDLQNAMYNGICRYGLVIG